MNLNLSSPFHTFSLLNLRLKNPQNLCIFWTTNSRGIPFDLMDATLLLLPHKHPPNLLWSRHNDVVVVTPALDGDERDMSPSANGSVRARAPSIPVSSFPPSSRASLDPRRS
jgi:hypothetical protein